MAARLAINGFGRIGRLVFRAVHESGRDDVEVVAVNDLAPPETSAHLLQFDSVHGRFPGTVSLDGERLAAGDSSVAVLAEPDPQKLPWGDLNVDVVLECTGRLADRDGAAQHLEAGAARVLVSAPAKDVDRTVVVGVNDSMLQPSDRVVSNASCTTNCLAPVAKVLHQLVGLDRGYMTTVHAYTADQRLQDTMHGDLRRARGAAMSLIPTSTGAARAIGLVLPELAGRLDGCAIRVPTANVSLVDLVFDAGRATSADEINAAMAEAADGALRGVLAYTEAPLVSCDFNHVPASATFDATQTQVVDGRLVRVLAWYDNEWGFSNRMADTAARMAAFGGQVG